MKLEIAKKWVKALRSKKYRQAKGVLKTKTKSGSVSHCCLGVLCELYQQERKKAKKPEMFVDDFSARDLVLNKSWTSGGLRVSSGNRIFEFDGANTVLLPDAVQAWAGMYDNAGCFRGDFRLETRNKFYSALAEMNDDGCRFSTIADTIEKYVAKI